MKMPASTDSKGFQVTSGATSSTPAALPYSGERAIIYNGGTGIVYVAFGNASVVADITCPYVPPGQTFDYTISNPNYKFVAVVAPAGGGQVNFLITTGV